MDPTGKVIVVTGAAGGIGSALVRALVAAGATKVIATDLDEPRTSFAPDVVVNTRLDVADADATARLVDEVERAHGPIALWFANAGVAGGGSYDAPDSAWDLQWQVNVMAHVYASRALLPRWLERGEGHLVTTASMAGILTSLGDGVYSATKHAAVGFAEWMAITYGDRGVKVSCVCPGAVDTPMLRGAIDDPDKADALIGGGGAIPADDAAARVIEGVREDRFLILTHPAMQEFMTRKAGDTDRWIRGMSRMLARSRVTPLYHFSEDPSITVFAPHVPRTNPTHEPAVWAIDARHAPVYWFPRDCPRGAVWANDETQCALLQDLFHTTASRVHATELAWLDRMREVQLYVYELDGAAFEEWPPAEGQWIARHPVEPLAVRPMGDLLDCHVQAGIELRFVPELATFWREVVASGLPFSGVRLR